MFSQAFAKSGLNGVLNSVATASDALLFLNRLGPHKDAIRPRLIVLDLSLPRFDGREFLEVLRGNPRFRDISVIILTGSESFRDMQKSRDLGATDYVVKPKTQQELIELIASFGHWLIGSSSGIPIQ
jgi:chemotaxis family two-component system response regulator Rcp1